MSRKTQLTQLFPHQPCLDWSWIGGESGGEKTKFSTEFEEDLFIGQALWQAASCFDRAY